TEVTIACWGTNTDGQTNVPSEFLNAPPVARSSGPYWGTRGLSTSLDGTTSSDPDGDPLTFSWDFGDGTTGTGPTPSHAYAELGVYLVTLTVTDSRGLSAAVVTTTTIEAPAPLVAAGEKYSCALRANGTARCWGSAPYGGDNVPSGTTFQQLTAGFSTTCGLKTDGTIACYGSDGSGQTSVPAGSFREVSIGKYHGCALAADGAAHCWGLNAFHAKDLPAGTYAQVSAGWLNTCAIRADGTIICAGIHYPVDGGTLAPPAGVFRQVSAGEHHACALRPDRTLVCWGFNTHGEVGGAPTAGIVTYGHPGTYKEVRAGISHTCAVRSDGTAACWGYGADGRSTPPSGTFSGVTASSAHSCGMRSDATIACWGTNTEGQTGVLVEFLPPGGTPSGSAVAVAPADPVTGALAPMTLTFTTVTGGGLTTATTADLNQGGSPPAPTGFRLGTPATYYDIQTTAAYGGPVTVCINYSSVIYGSETQLRLLHFEGGIWRDITASQSLPSNTICGTVSSLSPFLVAEVNLAPVVTRVALPGAPVPLGQSAALTASFTDGNPLDIHTASIDWDDGASASAGVVQEGAGSGLVTGHRTFTSAGVYTVGVTVSDGTLSGSRSSAMDTPAYLVVYDPSGGFVTGGGWIDSPAGACLWTGCAADGGTIGKASFGFVSRYKKGTTVPSGSTEFQFHAGNLDFSSTSYQWLVVAGARAQYKGEGTIGGAGAYGFLLTAIDGALPGGGGSDRFRIKIWNKASGVVVYDN
ncbi:MAG TPA: PKD domain-containing protein, partial [Gemmatimonadales bacterium]|nr:PKD domain-containing protein [Gemmatimonadales bacterium]